MPTASHYFYYCADVFCWWLWICLYDCCALFEGMLNMPGTWFLFVFCLENEWMFCSNSLFDLNPEGTLYLCCRLHYMPLNRDNSNKTLGDSLLVYCALRQNLEATFKLHCTRLKKKKRNRFHQLYWFPFIVSVKLDWGFCLKSNICVNKGQWWMLL